MWLPAATSFPESGRGGGVEGERVDWGQPPALTVGDRWVEGEATVTVRGEIDISTAGILAGRLAAVIGRGPRRLVIDMAGVDFMDSSGLHALIRVRAALPEECPVVLRSLQQQVRRVLEVSGLSTVFDFG
ncbi:MAG: STAS domain-containing protein [Micromonosporaceae bacterium]